MRGPTARGRLLVAAAGGGAVLALVAIGVWLGARSPVPKAPAAAQHARRTGGREAGMSAKIEALGHASFRLSGGGKVVYVDPYKLDAAPHDATAVLVTHAHFDHCSPEDVAKVAGPESAIVAPADCGEKLAGIGSGFVVVNPGAEVDAGGVPVKAVAAYNTDKKFHPKANGWVGYVVTIGGETVYHAGDTDVIPEMEGLAPDVALLPVGGTYTMTAEEAAEAFAQLEAKRGVPMHFGSVAGSRADADRFLELIGAGG